MSRAGAVTLVLITALFSGCRGDAGHGIQEPTRVTRVTISAPTTRIRVGDTVQLTATAEGVTGTLVINVSVAPRPDDVIRDMR
jgi:hypothetical protein